MNLLTSARKKFEEFTYRIEKLYSIARGRPDIKSKLQIMSDPENILTSSRLNKSQIRSVAIGFSSAEQWPFMKPLKDYLKTLATTVVSDGGKGRDEQIRFAGAIAESKLLQNMGFVKSQEMEKG